MNACIRMCACSLPRAQRLGPDAAINSLRSTSYNVYDLLPTRPPFLPKTTTPKTTSTPKAEFVPDPVNEFMCFDGSAFIPSNQGGT